jgi:hypothetical protein
MVWHSNTLVIYCSNGVIYYSILTIGNVTTAVNYCGIFINFAPGGLGCPKLIQMSTASEDAKPATAPAVLAKGTHIPRVNRPSKGPPTIPNTDKAA